MIAWGEGRRPRPQPMDKQLRLSLMVFWWIFCGSVAACVFGWVITSLVAG